MNFFRIKTTSSRVRLSAAEILIAAVVIELSAIAIVTYAKREIVDNIDHIAHTELDIASLKIADILSDVQSSVKSMAWTTSQHLDRPDSIFNIMSCLVSSNVNINNAAVCFRENFFPKYGKWFEPVASKGPNGEISLMQIGSAQHDYLSSYFYKKAIREGKDYWSEPYWNEAGTKSMVVSYSYPVYDRDSSIAGFLCADVTLDWLSEISNIKPLTHSSGIMLLSREGRIMVYPYNNEEILSKSVLELDDKIDPSASLMNKRMVAGERGDMHVIGHDGKEWLAFFKPVHLGILNGKDKNNAQTGWSIAVLCPKNEIYASLYRMQRAVIFFMLVGLLLMCFLVWRTMHSLYSLSAINAQRNRLDGELQAAKVIQQGMLPHNDYSADMRVSICGSQTPAKEVGGDLYDYFVRDEKLFFCIGDVSGKGVPAALLMAVTRSLFRTIAAHHSNPARILDMMNDSMTQTDEHSMFVTFFIGILDLPTGNLHYCNAGHDAPILIHGDGHTTLDVNPNLPLGAWRGFRYNGQNAHIGNDTSIFLFTDGLTEAKNKSKEMFRISRVKSICTTSNHDPHLLINSMTAAVHDFVNDAEQSDDMTMLAIRYDNSKAHETLFEKSLTLKGDIGSVKLLGEFTYDVCRMAEIDESTAKQIRLALEEAVVNVINYAYLDNPEGKVQIDAQVTGKQISFVITDSGAPFDPTSTEEADTSLNAEERPIGGLGIYIIRQLMDSINYERIDGYNILTLRKNRQQ